MSTTDTIPEIQFDPEKASRYDAHRVVKQAVLVPAPEGAETKILAEWGEEQTFVGPWYAVYSDGNVCYGVARTEFEETHASVSDDQNAWVKTTPVDAYQHKGEASAIMTVLADGTVETRNTAHDGDWLVRWPHGEVGVLDDTNFRKRYAATS